MEIPIENTAAPSVDVPRLVRRRVWCIKNSIESEGCGDETPQKPWQGEVTREKTGAYWVSLVGSDGVPDDDSNATAFCRERDMYNNEAEAQAAYCDAMEGHIAGLEAEVWQLKAELEAVRSESPNDKAPNVEPSSGDGGKDAAT